MNRHLDWNELDAAARGLIGGPAEVHLAECGDCAGRLGVFRDEEKVLRDALEPDAVPDLEIEAVVRRVSETRLVRPRTGLLPLAAAAALVAALVIVLGGRPGSDPIGEALAKGDRPALLRLGAKAAPHAPAALADELRRLPVRVLYAEAESRGEYRMLRPALLKDAGLLVHTMLLNSTDADLYGKSESAIDAPSRFREIATIFPLADADLAEYDVVILGPVDAQRLASGPEVLRAAMTSFVSKFGGTLVLVAGPKSSPADAHHALGDLLPVDLARSTPVTAAAVREERRVRWHLEAPLRAGAEVLEPAAGGAPLVTARKVGRGRVIFVGSDDFWSWGPAEQYRLYRGLIVR